MEIYEWGRKGREGKRKGEACATIVLLFEKRIFEQDNSVGN